MEISLLFLTIMNVFGLCTIVNTENKFDLKGLTLSDILSRHLIQNEEVDVSKAYITEKDVSEVDVSEVDVSKAYITEKDVSEEDWDIL